MIALSYLQGVYNMNKYSPATHSYVNNLVLNHAKRDYYSEQYELSVDDLSDFELNELSALIIKDIPYLSCEATSPDNKAYDEYMLPALLTYMSDITNKDNEIEFNQAWKRGITEYVSYFIKELLIVKLEDYNSFNREDHRNSAYRYTPSKYQESQINI